MGPGSQRITEPPGSHHSTHVKWREPRTRDDPPRLRRAVFGFFAARQTTHRLRVAGRPDCAHWTISPLTQRRHLPDPSTTTGLGMSGACLQLPARPGPRHPRCAERLGTGGAAGPRCPSAPGGPCEA